MDEITPRTVFVCDTCELVFYRHDGFRGNRDDAGPCIDAGHDVYGTGIGRLEMATVRRYLAKPEQLAMF